MWQREQHVQRAWSGGEPGGRGLPGQLRRPVPARVSSGPPPQLTGALMVTRAGCPHAGCGVTAKDVM